MSWKTGMEMEKKVRSQMETKKPSRQLWEPTVNSSQIFSRDSLFLITGIIRTFLLPFKFLFFLYHKKYIKEYFIFFSFYFFFKKMISWPNPEDWGLFPQQKHDKEAWVSIICLQLCLKPTNIESVIEKKNTPFQILLLECQTSLQNSIGVINFGSSRPTFSISTELRSHKQY